MSLKKVLSSSRSIFFIRIFNQKIIPFQQSLSESPFSSLSSVTTHQINQNVIKTLQKFRSKVSSSYSLNIKAQLFAWGGGNFGQLGVGSDANKPLPQLVEELHNLTLRAISAKGEVSAALTKDGKIYTWGRAKVS
jgi:alpha-tubulin suppressor-like RCC1 family protein